jgi:hypothetical protein
MVAPAKYKLPEGSIPSHDGSRFMAVSPSGHVAALKHDMPLKDGWRLATADDAKKAESAEKARVAAEKSAK